MPETSHYCLARINVPPDNEEAFHDALDKVRPFFRKHNWTMRLNLRPDPLLASVGGSSVPNQYLHLWTIPNFDSLIEVMFAAADTEDYVELEKLVVGERQELALGLIYDPAWMDGTPAAFPCYLLEQLEMVRSPARQNDFHIAMNFAKAKMKDEGWELCYAMNYSTGTISRYGHLWGVPRENREEGLKAYLHPKRKWASKFAAGVQSWDRSWWNPVRA